MLSNNYFTLYCAVPSGAPSNISAVTVTSENISLEWIAPEPAERNGVILGYIIRYVHFQAGRSSTVEAQTTDVFISNLEPHNLYTFSIAARTTIGIGPFSENIQIRTAEAGELNRCRDGCDEIFTHSTLKPTH